MLGPEASGRRLDKVLAERLPEHSRTEIARWIAEGRVTVDGQALAKRTLLEGGETVTIEVPPPRPATVEPEDVPLEILHEDDHVLVLDKPPGLTVHPGSGRPDGTLANALVHHFRNLPERLGSDRPGIVHRLDMDTSGVMVVAKTEAAQRALALAFAERRVEKTYLACVQGVPEKDEGTIDAPLGRSPIHRTKMTVDPEGRAAVTFWRVLRRLPRHALLECRPRTGRTHQIRVHLASIGHPIAGDPIYGNPNAMGTKHVPRLLLHAWKLVFPHPETGAPIACEARPPPDFEAALAALATLRPRRG